MGKFSKHLADVMTQYSVKVKTMAMLLGVSKDQVTAWIKGEALPEEDKALRFAELFEQDDQLVSGMIAADRAKFRESRSYSDLITMVRKMTPEQAMAVCSTLQNDGIVYMIRDILGMNDEKDDFE